MDMPTASSAASSSQTLPHYKFFKSTNSFSIYDTMSSMLLSYSNDNNNNGADGTTNTTTTSSGYTNTNNAHNKAADNDGGSSSFPPYDGSHHEHGAAGMATVAVATDEKTTDRAAAAATEAVRWRWKRTLNPKMQHTCDVILGDRFNIPYALLRSRRSDSSSSSAISAEITFSSATTSGGGGGRQQQQNQKVLINYFKGSHRLTLKAAMAKLLRDSPVAARGSMPKTFILTIDPLPSSSSFSSSAPPSPVPPSSSSSEYGTRGSSGNSGGYNQASSSSSPMTATSAAAVGGGGNSSHHTKTKQPMMTTRQTIAEARKAMMLAKRRGGGTDNCSQQQQQEDDFVVMVAPPRPSRQSQQLTPPASAVAASVTRGVLEVEIGGSTSKNKSPCSSQLSSRASTPCTSSRLDDTTGLTALSEYMARHPDKLWIVKASAGCKGQGIIVTNEFGTIRNAVLPPPLLHVTPSPSFSSSPVSLTPSTTTTTTVSASAVDDSTTAVAAAGKTQVHVVQEYVRRPFLIDGRKCDIRVWVLLTSPYNIYIFNQGSCRTASKMYTTDQAHLGDNHIHLTNHDLQKDAADFGKYEPGNELWYKDLRKHVNRRWYALQQEHQHQQEQQQQHQHSSQQKKQQGSGGGHSNFSSFDRIGDGGDAFTDIVLPEIHQVIVECLLAAREHMEVPSHDPFECFQLFGFDLMLDEDLKCHLIEINGSPGCAERWLHPMVQGMIDQVIRPKFPPLPPSQYSTASFTSPSLSSSVHQRQHRRSLSASASASSVRGSVSVGGLRQQSSSSSSSSSSPSHSRRSTTPSQSTFSTIHRQQAGRHSYNTISPSQASAQQCDDFSWYDDAHGGGGGSCNGRGGDDDDVGRWDLVWTPGRRYVSAAVSRSRTTRIRRLSRSATASPIHHRVSAPTTAPTHTHHSNKAAVQGSHYRVKNTLLTEEF